MKNLCYICGKERAPAHMDNHHVDCTYGAISDETVPLCRRCHRTYHDLGVEWVDDKYLDKAIELENRRRKITYANLKDPVIPLHLLERKDIVRSDYWYKKHGIKVRQIESLKEVDKFVEPSKIPCLAEQFVQKLIDPLCGWDWLKQHINDTYPEQWIEISFDDKVIAKVEAPAKRGTIRKVMAIVRGK